MRIHATSKLEAFSQRFAVLLLARVPELEQHIVAPREFQQDSDLYIEFPCPFPSEVDWPLVIWTERGREVGVGVDACHTQFRCGKDGREPEVFSEALSFLDDIFTERVIVVSYSRDGRLGGASFASPDETETEVAESPPGILVRVRSW